ncbi:ABC transporter ATP-binding protein [Streptomyces sp. NA04227]|uniref:ABC transporter ATP-binding protein n=1 Tax=Streptomyces sp. NA04227 TaxID=2742136 RepID=UPI001591BAFC|nr:ABC transporter ATP-binding protein [Streptomyces sp. NA04227]QKW10449.1 ABC transporter ATP-binding protein [Streptomyces sp. NA04227]
MRIDLDGVSWAVGGRTVVRDVSLHVGPGETVGLIGPNGSGKSSLLRCAAGLRTLAAGAVRYDGADIRSWSARRLARQIAFVEQAAEAESDLRLADVVALGRTPFRDRWRDLDGADLTVIDAALARTGLSGLGERGWQSLSGGERQRAQLARALAQQPWGILLDEPTNHLDVKHQWELMDLLATTDQTVLVALHDLPLAARFCDRLVLMHHGAAVASGRPEEVLTPAHLAEVFEMDAEVGKDNLGHLTLTYRGTVR